jgi:hypothetical protein
VLDIIIAAVLQVILVVIVNYWFCALTYWPQTPQLVEETERVYQTILVLVNRDILVQLV